MCAIDCVLVRLDWAEPMMFFFSIACHMFMHSHAYVLSFQYTCYIWTVLGIFWLPLSLPLSSVCVSLCLWHLTQVYTLVHMSMHESCLLVCRPCFNTMKLWKFDRNLHLSLADTTFCLPYRCFACFLVSLLAMSIMLTCFMRLSYAFSIFSFHCLSTGFLSLPLLVHTWSDDAWG